MKLYLVYDCEGVFVSNFQIYTGKETNIELNPSIGVSGSVVSNSTISE
jgi:hypothetical protein